MFDRYRKEMAVNVEDIENILVAVLSGDEQEIYKALTKKKEIIDKSPNLRTVDEKNMLQSLSKKIRKQVWGALRANSKLGLCYTPWYVVCGMWYVRCMWYVVCGMVRCMA